MAIYKLYIDVLFTVSTELENDIEIEAFGHQQYELLGNQLSMSDIVTIQAETATEAISKARTLVNDQYATTTNLIGFYRIVDGSYGYLDIQQYQACHIHFADETDDEYEEILEEINAAYYNLISV